MIRPGTVQLLAELSDGAVREYEPQVDAETESVSYPAAAEVLGDEQGRPRDVLGGLAERGLLNEEFREKTYVCPRCNADGLRYTTACETCESQFTVATTLLEHPECGAVAPRTAYETEDGHACPDCGERIHPAHDVERVEGHRCQSCGEWTTDPARRLKCRDCDALVGLSDGVELILRAYDLSTEGERWLQSRLTTRRAVADALEERGFDVEIDATVRATERDRRVHVLASDPLLDRRIVVGIGDRPTGEDVETLRELAAGADADPLLVTSSGEVGPRAATLSEGSDVELLAVRDGEPVREYEVVEDPGDRPTLVQRLTSAVPGYR